MRLPAAGLKIFAYFDSSSFGANRVLYHKPAGETIVFNGQIVGKTIADFDRAGSVEYLIQLVFKYVSEFQMTVGIDTARYYGTVGQNGNMVAKSIAGFGFLTARVLAVGPLETGCKLHKQMLADFMFYFAGGRIVGVKRELIQFRYFCKAVAVEIIPVFGSTIPQPQVDVSLSSIGLNIAKYAIHIGIPFVGRYVLFGIVQRYIYLPDFVPEQEILFFT